MATTLDKAIDEQLAPFGGSRLRRVCVITSSLALEKQIRVALSASDLVVRPRLANLITDFECDLCVVDAKAPDIGLWPAPLLVVPDSKRCFWLFLVAALDDFDRLMPLPPHCAVFERSPAGIEQLAEFLRKRSDPDAAKKFSSVDYLESPRTFLVRMDNGTAYALKLADVPGADESSVRRWALGRGGHYFTVVQESGNQLEIPWDTVLFHCEPSYEFYKGKLPPEVGKDRAARIGERVTAARLRRGMSVSDLAERAGMKRPNLSRLEHGRHEPSLETIARIAQALGVTVVQLVTAEG